MYVSLRKEELCRATLGFRRSSLQVGSEDVKWVFVKGSGIVQSTMYRVCCRVRSMRCVKKNEECVRKYAPRLQKSYVKQG